MPLPYARPPFDLRAIAAFHREVDCRAGLDSATVISILARHGGDTPKIPAEALTQFPQIRLSTEPAGQGTSLNLLLVMERGSSDLSDIISHADLAGKNMLRVRTIALSAAKCLQYLHSKGKMHGDFKVHRIFCAALSWAKCSCVQGSKAWVLSCALSLHRN